MLTIRKFGSGDMPFSVRRVSQAAIIPETVSLPRKSLFFSKMKKDVDDYNLAGAGPQINHPSIGDFFLLFS